MSDLLLLLGAGLLLIAGVVVLRAGEGSRWRRTLVSYRLQLPYGVRPEAATAFAIALGGLVAPRSRRWFAARGVIIEITADHNGISLHPLVPQSEEALVLSALRATLPGVRVTPDPEHQPLRPTLAGELGLSRPGWSLATERAETVSAAIFASTQPLEQGERVALQYVVRPAGPTPALRSHRDGQWNGHGIGPWGVMSEDDAEGTRTRRAKQAYPLLLTNVRLGVTATSKDRAKALLARLTAAFHAANAPGTHFYRRPLPSRMAARNLAGRYLPVVVPACPLNAAELAMLAFPVGNLALPGLRLGGARLLAPMLTSRASGASLRSATFRARPGRSHCP